MDTFPLHITVYPSVEFCMYMPVVGMLCLPLGWMLLHALFFDLASPSFLACVVHAFFASAALNRRLCEVPGCMVQPSYGETGMADMC